MNKVKLSSLKTIGLEDLSKRVDINDSFQYGHLWDLISSSPEVIAFLILYTKVSFLNDLIVESKKELVHKKTDGKTDGMEQIEIYFMIDRNSEELICCWEVHGIGYEEGKFERYGLDFTAINEIKGFDVVFSQKTTIVNLTEGQDDADGFGSIDCVPVPTILEILDSVIFEASFYGPPSNREKQLLELKSRIDDVESGSVKCVSSEEVFDIINKKIKDLQDGL